MSTEDAILELCNLSISLCALGKLSAHYASEPGEVGNDVLSGVGHLVSLAGDRVYELAEEIEWDGRGGQRQGGSKACHLRPVRPAGDVVNPAPTQEHAQVDAPGT